MSIYGGTEIMIYYCEQCKQYWKDELNLPFDWVYCTIDGIQISLCMICLKETHEIIENPMPECGSNINENYNIKNGD